jgi:hypothetical protein
VYTLFAQRKTPIVKSLKAYGTVGGLVKIKNMELQLRTFVRMLLCRHTDPLRIVSSAAF